MANLNDMLNGLVATDAGIIEKLKKMQENVEDNLQSSIEDLEDNLQSSIETLKKGASSYSIVDHNTIGASTGGSIVNDNYASDGKCCILTQSDSNLTFFTANFSDVKCGHYGLNVRRRPKILPLNNC